jgi:glycogen(starch) synthase
MRVLFWSGGFWPFIGGIEVRAAKLLPALQKRGYEFIVVTGQGSCGLPPTAKFESIPVHRFSFTHDSKNMEHLFTVVQQIADLKREFAPDLIHRTGFSLDSLHCLLTANAHPAPLLVTLTNDLRVFCDGRNSVLTRLLQSADWVSSVSAAALAQARQLVPDIVGRSSVVHNGVDDSVFSPTPLPDIPRLLCLGRLVPQKGIDIALNALPSVLDRFPQTRLTIAGNGVERVALEEQAQRLGLADAVEFIGWVSPDHVPAVLGSATAVVMPSRWEGLPNVALQAALMARPVIGTRVGGLIEIVEHQQTGLLVENGDNRALADAISFLLANPETAARMGQAARARVMEEFSWDRYIDAYDNLYRQVISSGARPR